MAQNTTVTLTAGTWTQLTNSNVTAIRVQNRGRESIFLQATVGANAPSNTNGCISLGPLETLVADLTLAQVFPGVAGANRVYALASVDGQVSFSHA